MTCRKFLDLFQAQQVHQTRQIIASSKRQSPFIFTKGTNLILHEAILNDFLETTLLKKVVRAPILIFLREIFS